ERFHAWFKGDSGFHRVYPWVLLGPYIALLASLFPLERGRLRLSLPINVVGCVAFIAACHLINVRTEVTFAKVTVIKWQRDTERTGGGRSAKVLLIKGRRNGEGPGGSHETKTLEHQILKEELESPPQELPTTD